MTTCPRCSRPISPTEPTATMTYYGLCYSRLHVRCAHEMQAHIRDLVVCYVQNTTRLAAEVRSLRIVPPDDDGLTFDAHGELVWQYG